jgi:hypothetical protein
LVAEFQAPLPEEAESTPTAIDMKPTLLTIITGSLSLAVAGLLASSCSTTFNTSSEGTHRMGPPGKDRQMDDSMHNHPGNVSSSEGTHRMGPPGKGF